jgi:Ni,Fe-hydrogenase maturation factor
VLVVGCEPKVRMSGDEEDVVGELSEPVRAAVPGAVELVESLVKEMTEGGKG